jgi:hypothetical protein
MAVVKGVKEVIGSPLYSAISVRPKEQLRDVEPSSTLKFFVNVQGLTKLETNLQSASVLPHYNTFEARAMRVVISDLPPEFPDDPTVSEEDLDVTDNNGHYFTINNENCVEITHKRECAITANLELGVDRVVELFQEARKSKDGIAELDPDDEAVTLLASSGAELKEHQVRDVVRLNGSINLSLEDIEGFIDKLGKDAPPIEQLDPNNGSGTMIGKIIYNTVTTFFVGEKQMIQMPTWFFPAGAGPYSQKGAFTTHGEPSPLATFRFPSAVNISANQNFRVEIEIPDSDTLKDIQKLYGPFKIWVVLDGYLTRDVQ